MLGFIVIPALLLTSCKDKDSDDPIVPTKPAFEVMTQYMLANNLDLDKILTSPTAVSFVASPPHDTALNTFINKYHIIDIRTAADYTTKGYIENSKNVAFADILTEAATATKPILVVCYTGQTACYATALLRLYGYPNTQALKWGMAGWNSTLAGPWNSAIGNTANGHSNWTYSPAPAKQTFSAPKLTNTGTDGLVILKQRVQAVVAAGYQGVNGVDVLNTPANYFINNYFSEVDYLGFGHINGAYRIQPLLLSDKSYLNLDPSATSVVTYCYTGQTSALISAYLRVLGYNAFSFKFGINSIYNNNTAWTTNKWSSSVPKNLPLKP